MASRFQSLDLARFLTETPQKVLTQIQSPQFLVQAAIIAVGCLLALWLSRLARGPLTRGVEKYLPRSWAPAFLRAAEYVLFPLHWLAILWAGAAAGLALDLPLPLLDAAINLVFAWIAIRLLSFTVRSHAVSVMISIVGFTAAALNILDLYRPLLNWMNRIRLYDSAHTHISLLGAVNAVVILIVLLWLMRLLYGVLLRRIARSDTLTPSVQVLLSQLLKILLPVIAVMIALQSVGVDLTTLTVAFGALGLGVGLGLQKLVSNLVSGLSLIIGKVIKPGDVLRYKESYGWVTTMTTRYVTLRTRDGIEHLVPNDYFIENGVENWSYSDAVLRLHVPVGISYDCDPHQAIALCREAAQSVTRVLSNPAPLVLLKGFGDSSVDLEVRFWIDDPTNGTANVKSEVLLAIWDRFKAAGITIPYPQRDVHIVSGGATKV